MILFCLTISMRSGGNNSRTQIRLFLACQTHRYYESVSVPRSIILDVPILTYAFVKKNEETIKKTLRCVCQGHIHDSNVGKINVNELDIEFRQESNDARGQRIQALNDIVVIVVPNQADVRGHLG